MATPQPTDGVDRSMPHGEEAVLILRAVASAPRPTNGLTGLQATLFRAIVHAMLGLDVDVHTLEPVEPDVFAGAPARRDRMLRTRLVQHMELLNLVLQPLDETAARRVEIFAEELCLGDEGVHKFRALAEGSLQLAAHDFDRNRYLKRLEIDGRLDGLRPPNRDPDTAHRAWATPVVDDVAARWRSLGQRPPNTNGRHVDDFYVSRVRFSRYAGLRLTPAYQDDWVHVLADNGTTVEAEIEAFGFIALASDDPDAFALPAMVINLFETGAVMGSAGIADVAPRHLSRPGMPARLATHSAAARLSRRQRLLRVRLVRTDGAGPRRAAPRTWRTADVTGSDCGRQRPALASRRHEPRPAGRGSEREGSNRHHVTHASEAGMTAKPCDPTTTAQEEGR